MQGGQVEAESAASDFEINLEPPGLHCSSTNPVLCCNQILSCVFAEESTQDVQDALDALMKSEDAHEMRDFADFSSAKERMIDAEKLRIR